MSEVIDILKKLIKEDTSNPPGNEYKVAKIVRQFFDLNQIRYNEYNKDDNRPNIVGIIGKGEPKLMIIAHMDTVPAGEGWKYPPFKATIKGDKIYGRGTVDNKGPLAAMLMVAKQLNLMKDKISGTVMFTAVSDEEKGSNLGMKYVIKKVKPDAAIIPDVAGNMKKIIVAEKGALFLLVEFFGKSAHGSRPYLGENAILLCLDFIQKIKNHKFSKKKHDILGEITLNVGEINGGSSVNSVPSYCKVALDIRYIPGVKKQQILKQINLILDDLDKSKFKVSVINHHEPHVIEDNSKIVKSIKKGCKIIGICPEICGISGSTVAKMLVTNGVPAVGFSCGDDKETHAANENISITELNNFIIVLKESIISYFSK